MKFGNQWSFYSKIGKTNSIIIVSPIIFNQGKMIRVSMYFLQYYNFNEFKVDYILWIYLK